MPTNETIGDFRILDRLGRGGMGTVFRVRDGEGKIFALKVLNQQTAEVGHRFKREFLAASSLRHDNIVGVYELYEDPSLFFTMEYVQGTDLLRFIHEPGVPTIRPDQYRKFIFVLGQILKALDYMHAQGIVHRDLKPDNILVNLEGIVKITDFGLAKGQEGDSFATALGTVMGTVGYLAPEQILGETADPRSDLYSIGVIVYQVLTGKLPYPFKDAVTVMQKQVNGELPPAPRELNPAISLGWEKLAMHMLSRDPADRPQGIAEILNSLRQLWRQSGAKDAAPVADPKKLLSRSRAQLTIAQTVGRVSELAVLEDRLGDLIDGRGAVAVLSGEAGVGKSRLVEDLRVRARATGVKVLLARAPMSPMPYGHFQPALERVADWMAGSKQGEIATSIGPEWAALRQLVPRFNKVNAIRALAPLAALPPRQARDRELRVLTELLRSIVCRSPTLLVFEDLHAADELSVALLAHLTEQLIRATSATLPVLVLVTVRDGELADDGPGRRFLRKLGDVTRVELQRLSANDVAQLLGAVTGDSFDEAVSERLYEQSRGHPLLLMQMLQGLVDSGALVRDSGRWQMVSDAMSTHIAVPVEGIGGEVSENLVRTVRARLERLGANTRRVLEFGAVAGGSFRPEILAAAAGVTERDVLVAITDAMRAGMVLESERKAEPYRFSHQRLHDVLLAMVSPARRRAMHEAVAKVLESLSDPPIEELARQYDFAGSAEKAADYLSRAARLLAGRFDNGGALATFQRAMGAIDKLKGSSRPILLMVSVKREAAVVAELSGRLDDALSWSRESELLARKHGFVREEALAMNVLAHVLWIRNRYDDAHGLAEGARSHGRALADRAIEADALFNLGRISRRRENFDDAVHYFSLAITIYDELGDAVQLAEGLVNLAMVARKRGQHSKALRFLERALAEQRRISNRRGVAFAQSQVAQLRIARCEYDSARVVLEECLTIDREIGNHRGAALDVASIGSLDLLLGDYSSAAARFDEALVTFREQTDLHNQSRMQVNLGHVRFRSGDAAQAIQLYRQGLEGFTVLGDHGGRSEALSAISAAEVRIGHLEQAKCNAAAAVALAAEVGLSEKEAWAQMSFARAATDATAAARAVGLAEAIGDNNLQFQAELCLALVLRRRRDPGGATAALERAAGIIEKLAASLDRGAAAFLSKPAVREVYQALNRKPPPARRQA